MNHFRRLIGQNVRMYHISQGLQSRLYEPTYLEAMKPSIPLYDALNIQMRGYDYSILENYQKFVHNMARNMEFDVEDAWAVPHQELKITTLKPKTEIVNSQYTIKTYERTVQITDVPVYQVPILLRALEASTPVGVTIQVLPHEEWHEEVRYVPDNELKALKQELDDMGGPSKKK